MKPLAVPSIVISMGTILFFSCKKDVDLLTQDQGFLQNARRHFEKIILTNPPSHAPNPTTFELHPRFFDRQVLWQQAIIMELAGGVPAVVIPVCQEYPFLIAGNISQARYNINDLMHLIIYKDTSKTFVVELLTTIPDEQYKYNGQDFTGIILVEDWWGNILQNIKYERDGTIKKSSLMENTILSVSKKPFDADNLISNGSMQVCYYIEGYNYSSGDPEGYYWREFVGCSYISVGTNPSTSQQTKTADYRKIGGGQAGGSGIKEVALFVIPIAENPIADVADYLKCFNNLPGTNHSFEVTLCIDQPEPGTRSTWVTSGTKALSMSNPIIVGHSFLVLKQTDPTRIISRSVGFYPRSMAHPLSPSDKGQMNNDELHEYNISLTITINSSQFFQMIEYIKMGNSLLYDLNSNNCTTFALSVLAKADVHLPRTKGTWPNGSGNNPGDLGEDVRNLTLSSNMRRETNFADHPNIGSCY